MDAVAAQSQTAAVPGAAGKAKANTKAPKKSAETTSVAPSNPAASKGNAANTKTKANSDPSELGEVSVTGKKALPAQAARRSLEKIPGGVSVIRAEDVERGRASTLADVLSFQPGITAQAVGGNDAIRISIRGSGLNRGAGSFREGVNYLFDGLPLTGPGGTPHELMEPLGLSYTEVLKGPNGFKYGGLALGGAVNFVTKTGYNASPFELHYEGGSFGYHKGLVSTGGVVGDADYYLSAIGSLRDGFQDHSQTENGRFIANFGYKFNENLDTRLIIRYGYSNWFSPGSLTLSQLKKDPTQANPASISSESARRIEGATWIGSKTTYRFEDDSKIEAGLVYHDYPIKIMGTQRSEWQDTDINASLKYFRTDHPFGLTLDTTVGYVGTNAVNGRVWTYDTTPGSKTYGKLLKKSPYGGSNQVLFFEEDLEVVSDLWVTLANQFIKINRTAEITYPVNNSYDRDVYNFAPRLGVRYDVKPGWQVFSNLSRSVEPADSWKYSGSGTTTGPTGQLTGYRDLKEQQALTFEIGARAREGIFDASLGLWRSWLNDQLLTVQIDPGPPIVTSNFNASPTIMQGIEVGLNTLLWREHGDYTLAVAPGERPHQLSLRQAYTFNDFFFENDAIFHGNKLPGLPDHFYQGELLYEHPIGLSLGFNAQVSSSYQLDYANTLAVPAYVIFGAKIGYQLPSKNFEVHVDLRNLTNEKYVTAISPNYNVAGKDGAYYSPGDGISAFGGFTYRY